MRRIPCLLVAGLLALAGCGEDDSESSGDGAPGTGAAGAPGTDAATKTETAERKGRGSRRGSGTGATITLGKSEFGRMLFDSNRQAIYVFERDGRDRTACYGECAEAWPPVLTDGPPKAARGVRGSLLGTIRRRDGGRQVTYAGRPLYFYAHERPAEVRCHNVNLNGGLWWVVGADGKRRP